MNIISCSKVIYPVLPLASPWLPLASPLVHPNLPLFYPYIVASYRVRDTPVNLPLLLLSYWKKEGDDFRVRVVAKASSTIYNLRILSKVKKVFFQNSVNENFLLGKIRRLSIWSTSFNWRWPFDVYFRWDQGWKRENYLSSSKKLSVSIKPQKSIDREPRTLLTRNFGQETHFNIYLRSSSPFAAQFLIDGRSSSSVECPAGSSFKISYLRRRVKTGVFISEPIY